MRPSRNAFIGYTYQEQITFLFLVMMDVQRKFNSLEIEADVENNLDDIKIQNGENSMFFQIKDYDEITLEDLQFNAKEVSIKGKKHLLASDSANVLIFKNIDVATNCKYYGLPALKQNNVYIISLSRLEADNMINKLYAFNQKRKITIDRFFKNHLDKRILKINKDDLPIIKVFDTKLLEETINIGKKHLEFSNILHLEGKPGIGKSHYVITLSKIYNQNIVYRFWISEQDKEKNARLEYVNFISDISKKLFHDYSFKSEVEIINEIKKSKRVFIIDGLDHVENYNNEDLGKFVQFINKLSLECKTIVLSRPLKYNTNWNKQILTNWNERETRKVLIELYHIDDYSIGSQIYNLTNGYPILVRFISEHYKAYKIIPILEKLKGIEDYYSQILKDVKTKTALTLFLTSRSFFMKSELSLFLSGEFLSYINEFINAYPYLFEIRLNRVSLFHDSFNKYLRELNIDYSERKNKVDNIVYQSIYDCKKRFMSRFSYFDLEAKKKLSIIKKFSSIKIFKEVVKDCIDFEAIRSFYFQIRESLNDILYKELSINNYYELTLILNIVGRDHIATYNTFLYTYTKSLIYNGYEIENITSSEYLFGMFHYVLENDSTILYNITSNDNYSTNYFLTSLENDVFSEEYFFEKYKNPFILKKDIGYYLEDEYKRREDVINILVNLYIHGTVEESLENLYKSIKTFIDSNENEGISIIDEILEEYEWKSYHGRWILNDSKKILLSLGLITSHNDFINLSLKKYIIKNAHLGSFDICTNILSYIRLTLHQTRKTDISSIGDFWTMYHKHKDYSVINIDVALKVFEEKGFITEEESIRKVVFTQSMSDKGIRHLLSSYIKIHSPDIIDKILKQYHFKELNISWLDLPSEYINALPDKVFNYSMYRLLEYNGHRTEIDFDKIINVFHSKKWSKILNELKFHRYKIRINEKSKELKELKKIKITLNIFKEEEKDNFYDSSYRYNNGILGIKDKSYIHENKLSVCDVSGYLDGNYSALAELDIYKIFNKNDVKKNLKAVFYNAILGKINSINMFGNLYYFVGNLPKLTGDYDDVSNISELYESFNTFIELSLLNERNQTS
ncbi:hypothetical protein [Formosa algae]|uniref:NACHT domain-containing protein n=1 Tax=Formosa algae TaxID=225843 RepID=A0A9X1CDV3_9FLAO|nr:hypothetical protein [Formosa algae]MBP1841624.1 hypothetical protein [Formosa algae]MDQ0337175.1 hypothetical protein [Formosa algae]OEI81335.1 hypothetical protein AST99_03595 [Formosa algae]